MLAGKIENRDYSVLVKLLHGKMETGILFLDEEGESGELHFKDGEIVGAVSRLDEGSKAVNLIRKVSSPSFRFESRPDVKSNLSMDEISELDLFLTSRNKTGVSIDKNSIISPNSNKKVETDTYDVKKWTILNIIGSGELFSRIQTLYSGSTAELISSLEELMLEGLIKAVQSESVENLFLFPKPIRVGLSQEETQVFWHIIDGISVFELISKINMNLEKLVTIIMKIILKKKMVLTNASGQIIEPWNIIKALELSLSVKPVKLTVQNNGRITSKPGAAVIDSLVVEIWKQQSLGRDINSIKCVYGDKRFDMPIEQKVGISNEIFFSYKDIKKLELEVGKIIECFPIID